jgi:hypothetical protein
VREREVVEWKQKISESVVSENVYCFEDRLRYVTATIPEERDFYTFENYQRAKLFIDLSTRDLVFMIDDKFES